ncbi:VCBS repeat-containing protein [Motiliproteus sp. MSK22-1]|uniref:FG-GAP repeat domain-containing protein n=1 Tax=Motiliproteus sp. MSK22-1 TaxID=1897630 RepID=UPI00097648D6|nr:VCBS repeat-containing protein [Motiliproteus sp. MSK22-1]OMH38305.1 hypothetical protein BGP75_08660 [Motiliproteus sp. MSK22-1]
MLKNRLAILSSFALTLSCYGQSVFADDIPYSTLPDWESEVGFCGTGIAFADINNDGYQDMVVSNGNDIVKQQLFVYYNDKAGKFNKTPDWVSDDFAFNGNLAVGDINKDGYIDVAVSVYLGPNHTYDGGGAKVYFNKGEGKASLEKTPSWSVTGFPSFNLALGDANADGFLDIALAAGNPIAEDETFAAQPDCKQPPKALQDSLNETTSTTPPATPHKSPARVFAFDPETQGFRLEWMVPDQVSMDVQFGDVNKDGYIDLILGNPVTKVYLGTDTGLSTVAGWQTAIEDYFANGLDFAASLNLEATNPKARVSSILTSNNNYMGGGYGRFHLYNFTSTYIIDFNPHNSSPSWSSQKGGWGSGVLFADVNNDGYLDLLAGRWAPPGSGVLQAPLEIYMGDGVMFEDKPSYTSDQSSWSVLEIIAVTDLDNGDEQFTRDFFSVPEEDSWRVITLNRQNIQNISGVIVNGKQLSPLEDYITLPGQNLVYLSNPAKAGSKIEVRYAYSNQLDIGVTNWDCTRGDYIFYWKNNNG